MIDRSRSCGRSWGEIVPALVADAALVLEEEPDNHDGKRACEKAMREKHLPHVVPRRLDVLPRLGHEVLRTARGCSASR